MLWPEKLPQTGNTIFSVMSALASEYRAVNLGQGFPDFPMNETLIHLVHEAMLQGHNQYTPMPGSVRLREALSKKIARLYGTIVDPATQITITPGATYAILNAFTTLLQPGDEVLLFEPTYDSYIPNILLNGAKPVTVPLTYPGYKFDWEAAAAKVTPRTKAIILNTPHNPTGTILTKQDITGLRKLVEKHNLYIISDEVYEHIVFDGYQHESILRYPDLLERSFVIFSFGKLFHCTGWKLGYAVSSPEGMKAFRQLHQFNAFTSNTPLQEGIAKYLEDESSYNSVAPFFQQKKKYFETLMRETRFTPLPTSGSFFQCYSYEKISDEPDVVFTQRLVKEAGVATIPVSVFYVNGDDHHVIRFCFAKKESTLQDAVARLKAL